MSLSKELGAYADIEPIIDVALKEGSLTIKCEKYGDAIRLRLRIYMWRKLIGRPVYLESLQVRLERNDVVISFNVAKPLVAFNSMGKPVHIPTPIEAEMKRVDEAAEMAREAEERREKGLDKVRELFPGFSVNKKP